MKLTKKENEIEIHSSNESEDEQDYSIQCLFKCVNNELVDPNININKITKLDLSMCNLTEIPIALKELNLKYLSLKHNSLKSVPLCLYGGLKHLEYLDLGCNHIENFDQEPDCLPNIKTINLNCNKFNNVPEWFLMFKCPNIENFNYSNNKAIHYNFLQNCLDNGFPKLRRLELQNSCLRDQDVAFLNSIHQLEYLNIGNNSARHGNIYNDLDQLFVKPKWHQLCVLLVDNASLVIFPKGICYLESLTELSVTGNHLSWLPHEMKNLRNLLSLDVCNNDLCALPECLVELQKLNVLVARNNNIEVALDFSLMPNLKTLDLYNNQLEDIAFDCNIIDNVDVEYNYLDTSKWTDFPLYQNKKDHLRGLFLGFRYNGPKEQPSGEATDSQSDKGSDYSYEKSYYHERSELPVEFCQTENPNSSYEDDENWDSTSNVNSCSDIDSEDQNWKGFEVMTYRIDNTGRDCASDDDWYFEDFEE